MCVKSARGAVLKQLVLPTTERAITSAVRAVRQPRSVAFEEGRHASWVHSFLCKHARVIVCDPRRNALPRHGSKTDRIDAEKLAELLRIDALTPVYHSADLAEWRALLRHYEALTVSVMRTKLRLRALFGSVGVRIPGVRLYGAKRRRQHLLRLRDHPSHQFRARALFLELEALGLLKASAQMEFVRTMAAHPVHSLLQTIPEIGPVRAAILIATVGTPDRFRSRAAFWAYAGVGLAKRTSGDVVLLAGRRRSVAGRSSGRPLRRRCSGSLRRVLRDAARGASRGRSELGVRFGYALRRGLAPKTARRHLARKIASIVLAVWRSGKPYDGVILDKEFAASGASIEDGSRSATGGKARTLTICGFGRSGGQRR